MPRIPESEIERIKKETDLAALVRSRGIELKPHGTGNLAGCCPFHDDKTPSFIVTPAKGLFHCLGCGAAGNAIQFVQKFDGVSFRHAFELLNDGPAAFESPPDGVLKKSTVPKLGNPLDPEAPDSELLAQVADYYHERLLQTPDALAYLEKRGLRNDELITRFKLGFADRTLGLRLPAKNRSDGKAIRERLQKLGIMRDTGHELLTGSLTVPIMDASGNVTEMYGRKITSGLRKGTPLHLYLPGPHVGIWNVEEINYPSVILCEAPLDSLTFRTYGFCNTTFIYGCHGFTDELFEALVSNKVQTVKLAYDADDAGNKAAERDEKRLAAVGIEVYRIRLPHGMDVNEYASKVNAPYPALHALIKSAEPLFTQSQPATPKSRAEAGAPSSLVALAAKKEAALTPEAQIEQRGDYRFLKLGPREYRVGGLEKNNSLEVMKIALRLRRDEDFHLTVWI